MTTPEERLEHDVINGVNRQVASMLSVNPDAAKAISSWRGDIAQKVVEELRIRWTIIERPRKQRTLRQDS